MKHIYSTGVIYNRNLRSSKYFFNTGHCIISSMRCFTTTLKTEFQTFLNPILTSKFTKSNCKALHLRHIPFRYDWALWMLANSGKLTKWPNPKSIIIIVSFITWKLNVWSFKVFWGNILKTRKANEDYVILSIHCFTTTWKTEFQIFLNPIHTSKFTKSNCKYYA